MQQKIICPLQSMGCGDILFTMSIAYKWIDEGYKVIWGVEDSILSIAKHFPEITFIDKRALGIDYNSRVNHEVGNVTVVPLRWSDTIMNVPYKDVMGAKYSMLGLDWKDWKKNFRCVRDLEAESRLYYDVLGLKDGQKYNLISQQFTTGGKRQYPINVNNGYDNVYQTILKDFSIIDWLLVMQKAQQIHAISSASYFLYLLYDMPETHIYVRRPIEANHDFYSYIDVDNKLIYH